MSKAVSLAIDIDDHSAAIYRSMAARSRVIRLVDDPTDCDALVCDDVEVAIRTIEAGKSALLVDPFAVSHDGCQQLAASSRAVPALTARFEPSIRQVKQALDAGKLGDPGLLRIHAWPPTMTDAGCSLQQQLDLAIWLFGGIPTTVFGCQRVGYTQAHLGFANGEMALIDIDTRIADQQGYYSLSLIGSTGAAYADDHRNMNLLFTSEQTRAIPMQPCNGAIAEMIQRFAISVASGAEFDVGFRQIQVVDDLAKQIIESAGRSESIGGVHHG